MKNIYLIGFMGTGKTAVGKALAKRLNLKFLDLDSLIEEKEGLKITEIFSQKGEPYFRKVEKGVVKEISQKSGLVVGCGGGVVLDNENLDNLKKTGIIVCLKASPRVILSRTKDTRYRPLLDVLDPKAKIAELLNLREPFYAKADYQIDTSSLTIDEVVANILRLIQ
ncbi:MAG: shikimate kinase [Candidatus Omnitrophota bacterium]